MSKQTERDGHSEEQPDAVEWGDVSKKSDGIVDSLLGGIGNGSRRGNESEAASPDADASQETADQARSDDAQALVRSILNGLQEPTLVVDADRRITHINDQGLALYECTEQDAVGTAPHGLQADGSPASDIVSEAIDRGEDIQQREETMLVEKDVTERNRQREKRQFLEQYQQDVLDDLQDKLALLAEGDLTIDPTVPRPEEDYDEAVDVYEEFTQLNDHLNRATDNIREIVDTLTENADTLSETSEALSANNEEVTASIQQIDASSAELASGADDLAEETQRANENVDNLSASIEEITATIQQIASGVDEQSNAMEEVAAKAQQLSVMSDRLHGRVDVFKLAADENGNLETATR